MNHRFAPGFIVRTIIRSCVSVPLLFCFFLPRAQAQANRETLSDGVEHWYVPELANGKSRLARKFEEVYDVLFAPKSEEPFGRSVAFLVGVANYDHLSTLPSVRNDIAAMRHFLLSSADFDEVYVAVDDIVSRDLIEQYVKGILPARMRKNDRLLFYYSGHGGDNRGKTGYMLFGNAQEGQFYGKDVLAIDSLNDWSRELPMQHILFILDSCASGLGIDPKSGTRDSDRLLVQTLSGNGSRTILTAGTASEATYAEDERQKTGSSFFTRALLTAFESRSASDQRNGFITVGDLFAEIELEMASFRVSHGKPTTPRMWKLQESEYRGTFVFLNPRAKATRLTAEEVNALGAVIVPKHEDRGPSALDTGTIEVISANSGYLYVDGQLADWMASGETRQFFRRTAAKHSIQFQGEAKEAETKEVTVESGGITLVGFGLRSPIDDTGAVPVGTLRIGSMNGLYGGVYIDNFSVGRLEKNGMLTVDHLTPGLHTCRILGVDQTQSRSVEIRPNETTSIAVGPLPPTGLTATVH